MKRIQIVTWDYDERERVIRAAGVHVAIRVALLVCRQFNTDSAMEAFEAQIEATDPISHLFNGSRFFEAPLFPTLNSEVDRMVQRMGISTKQWSQLVPKLEHIVQVTITRFLLPHGTTDQIVKRLWRANEKIVQDSQNPHGFRVTENDLLLWITQGGPQSF